MEPVIYKPNTGKEHEKARSGEVCQLLMHKRSVRYTISREAEKIGVGNQIDR